jgi:hypothetical protein
VAPDLLRDSLRRAAIADDDYRLRASINELSWLSDTRFLLKQTAMLSFDSAERAQALGKFGQLDEKASAGSDASGAYFVNFSAAAECEIMPGGKYRILNLTPGQFDQLNQ